MKRLIVVAMLAAACSGQAQYGNGPVRPQFGEDIVVTGPRRATGLRYGPANYRDNTPVGSMSDITAADRGMARNPGRQPPAYAQAPAYDFAERHE